MLANIVSVDGATVVDLFAGSGSFGIECLSRGAAKVIFVEQDRGALQVLNENLQILGFADRAQIVTAALPGGLGQLPKADLCFCDPPYALDVWVRLFEVEAEVMVGHADHKVEVPETWRALREKRYGRSYVFIAETV